MNKDIVAVVIDDNAFHRKIISHQLTIAGIDNISTFADGLTAIAEIKNTNVQHHTVIFLDLNMPAMDGVEFIAVLEEIDYKGALVLISGEDKSILESTYKLAQGYKLQVLGYVQKPLDQNHLVSLLSEHSLHQKNDSSRVETNRKYTTESLKHAIEVQELFNVYQPKINLKTGKMEGVEALVRWAHPDDGTVYPDQFIYLAEETNLINDLSLCVLDKALSDLRELKDEGLDLTLAVNVSMDDLKDRSFVKDVASMLLKYGIEASELTLEVTESKLMDDLNLTLSILSSLRLKHINLSIDDFGTGYSSMVQLRDMPFTELKLDQDFVHDAWKNKKLDGIFKASMQLAENLNMQTVVEGIEDVEDWRFAQREGANYVQGYFIAKPMMPNLLKDWNAEWSKRYLELLKK